jgi:putative membrane protein (TIGR04086 family)
MRWGRIIVGGFIAEVLLMVVAVPVFSIGGQSMLNWTAVIGSTVTSFIAALWVARRAESSVVLHGALTGLTAALIYIALMAASGQAQPPIYWVAHALKVVGGAAGGSLIARRTSTPSRVARASL